MFFFLTQIDTQEVDGLENGRPVCTAASNKAAVSIRTCLFSNNIYMYTKFY